MITCPDCGVPVQVRRLDLHSRKVHSRAISDQTNSQSTLPTARPTPRPRNEPPVIITSPPVSIKRTGVFYDDESFSVEVNGIFIGAAGSAREGWDMIEGYKRRNKG